MCFDQDGTVGVLLFYIPAVGSEKTLDLAVRMAAGNTHQKFCALIFRRDCFAEALDAKACFGRDTDRIPVECLQSLQVADISNDVDLVKSR
jgi:hypothetical protein